LILFALALAALVTWAYVESENLADVVDAPEGFDLDFPTPDGLLDPPARSLWALDATTGLARWRNRYPDGSSFVGAVGEILVLQQAGDGHLVAVDATTGEERWRDSPALHGGCLPVIDGSLVIGITRRGVIVARDAASGAEVWKTTSGPADCFDLVAASGTVIVGGLERGRGSMTFLAAYDSGNGAERWRVKGREVPGIPLKGSADGLLFTADENGSIHAIDALTGAVRWIWAPPHPVEDSVLLTATTVRAVVAGTTVGFSTVDPDSPGAKEPRTITVFVGTTDGIERWRTKSGAASSFAYDPHTDTLIEIGEPPVPTGRDPATGSVRGTAANPGGVAAAASGLALVGTGTTLAALDARTGVVVWTFEDRAQGSLVPLGGASGVITAGRK